MTVLQNISYILIKSRYHAYPSEVRYVLHATSAGLRWVLLMLQH